MPHTLYLNYNGNAEEAINFYKDNLNGTLVSLQRFGDTPMPGNEKDKGKIMHAVLDLQGFIIMFSDGNDEHKVTFGDNFSIALDFKSESEMEKAFQAMSAGGRVTMPLQDTFWGARFGMCTDKFGVNWMFNMDKNQQQ
jgi:PhnB protein